MKDDFISNNAYDFVGNNFVLRRSAKREKYG
jgi:hypothetical protein